MYDLAGVGPVAEGCLGTWAGRMDSGFDCTGSGGSVMTEALEDARRRGPGGSVDI